ncbi:MAG: hypothetical protein WAL26_23770, partial [Mycobacterium sp.]
MVEVPAACAFDDVGDVVGHHIDPVVAHLCLLTTRRSAMNIHSCISDTYLYISAIDRRDQMTTAARPGEWVDTATGLADIGPD